MKKKNIFLSILSVPLLSVFSGFCWAYPPNEYQKAVKREALLKAPIAARSLRLEHSNILHNGIVMDSVMKYFHEQWKMTLSNFDRDQIYVLANEYWNSVWGDYQKNVNLYNCFVESCQERSLRLSGSIL